MIFPECHYCPKCEFIVEEMDVVYWPGTPMSEHIECGTVLNVIPDPMWPKQNPDEYIRYIEGMRF